MSRSCTAFNSYSPATPPPPSSPMMVESEFEAAEVLARLSKEATASGYGGTGESVDSSMRTSTVRVKTELSPVDSPFNSVNSPILQEKKPVLLAFDLNEDQVTTFNQEEELQLESKCLVKAEVVELAQPNPASKPPHTAVKSRQNLSEAEKEAKRLRRVLANRESARQTIRRRQAQYEDLTRKVADLAKENENLKKEKESALEEYQALNSTNKKLNEKIAEQSESKPEESVLKTTSTNCSNNIPVLPFTNYPYITPNLFSVGGSSSHWCMVPYPLLIPVPDAKNAPNLIPLFPSGDKETGTSKMSLPVDVKTEFASSVEAPFGLSVNVVDQKPEVETCSNQMGGKEEQSVSHHGKRKVDAAKAAEARKRRRELKKMKSFYCRGHRNDEGLRLGESSHRSLSRNS